MRDLHAALVSRRLSRLLLALTLLVSAGCVLDSPAPATAPPAAGTPAAPSGAAPAPGQPPAAAGARVAAAAPAQQVEGRILEHVRAATFAPREIDSLEERFFVYGNALPAQYTVDWYRIRFLSRDLDGSELPMVAQVFVPRAAGQERPLYVFGPGTTGLKDECAPSHEEPEERNWGDFEAHLLSFAAQGYVAVMPDYASSRGASPWQYYYVAEMHARTMLDAARAGLRFTGDAAANPGGAKAANATFFSGYSQGGHAALAARDWAPKYAPELKVLGVIGYGARARVATMLEEAPYLAPYLFSTYARVYGPAKVPLNELLVPTVTRTLQEDMATKCIDEVPAYYGDYTPWIFGEKLDDAVDHGRLQQAYPDLYQLLEANNTGVTKSDVPVLLLQGLADTLVAPKTQRAFVQQLCGLGATVSYRPYQDIPHVLTRQVSYRDVLDWMGGITGGKAPRSDC